MNRKSSLLLLFLLCMATAFLTLLLRSASNSLRRQVNEVSISSLQREEAKERKESTPISSIEETFKLHSKTAERKSINSSLPEDSDSIKPVTARHNLNCTKQQSKVDYLHEPVLYMNNSCNYDPCIGSKEIKWHMVTFVKSAASHSKHRELLRRTWASYRFVQTARFDTIYVIGSAEGVEQALVEEEEKRYHDILQISSSDSYMDVAKKTLAGMQWASENLPDEYFYSSADDDMLVNIGKVHEVIDLYKATAAEKDWPDFPIVCMYELWKDSGSPFRNPKNKNYISFDQYRWPYWPKFCPGGMYSTSVRVIRQLWELSRTLTPLSTDDVWITGVLRQKLGMPDQMVVASEPRAAEHFFGFSKSKTDGVRGFMSHEWDSIFSKFKDKYLCKCD
ncbi:beta-1,3-galactosyltransferase 5-like [Clavelina lepadiformis]|uniref:beta-1,3-galactosyltransferase 5-like n=1 Tax=Clavelina lepadiformis TaxID=159417 RepID=UPI00404370AA